MLYCDCSALSRALSPPFKVISDQISTTAIIFHARQAALLFKLCILN